MNERLVETLPASLPLVLRTHWLVAVTVSVQTIARDDVGPEVVACSSQNTYSVSASHPRISGFAA